jgi:hypothetical protein
VLDYVRGLWKWGCWVVDHLCGLVEGWEGVVQMSDALAWEVNHLRKLAGGWDGVVRLLDALAGSQEGGMSTRVGGRSPSQARRRLGWGRSAVGCTRKLTGGWDEIVRLWNALAWAVDHLCGLAGGWDGFVCLYDAIGGCGEGAIIKSTAVDDDGAGDVAGDPANPV